MKNFYLFIYPIVIFASSGVKGICLVLLHVKFLDSQMGNGFSKLIAMFESPSEVDHSDASVYLKNEESDNIPEAKQIAEADFFRLLVENSFDGMCVFEDGIMTYASPAYKTIFGYDDIARELRTLEGVLERVHPDDFPRVDQGLQMVRQQIVSNYKYQVRFKRKNGSYCWVENSITRMCDEKGRDKQVFVITREITDRKEAEFALKKSEAEFKTLFCQNAMGILTVNADGIIQQANRKFCDTIAYPVDELVSIPLTSLIYPDDREVFNHIFESKVENDSKEQVCEKRLVKKNGDVFWAEIHLSLIDNGQQLPGNMIISLNDISPRKEAEYALESSKKTLETVVDNTTTLVFMKDVEGKYTFVNKVFREMFAVFADNLIGKTDTDVADKSLANSYRVNDLSVIKSGQPDIFEEIVVLPEGAHTFLSVKVPLKDSIGTVVGVCCISTDITERKKAEQELVDLKEKLELALSASKMGIWEWYVEGNKVAWYGDHACLYGVDDKDFGGTIEEVQRCLHPEDRNLGLAAFDKTVADGSAFLNTYRVVWPDKSIHWLHSHGNLVRNKDNEPWKIVGVTHDISLEKLATDKILNQNQELTELNFTKDKLFSIISHDLVNPLNSLMGFTQLLSLNYQNESNETIGQYLKMILKSAHAMADLLKNLTQWSVSQRKMMNVEFELISPSTIVESSFELLFAAAQNKRIQLINNIPDGEVAYGDEEMIKTILRNIIANAIKFSFAEGEISVSMRLKDQHQIVCVKDEGVGIEASKLNHLFSVIGSESKRGTAGEKGTGLGLLICKEFIEMNKGKIWAESELGKGARFFIQIPACPPEK